MFVQSLREVREAVAALSSRFDPAALSVPDAQAVLADAVAVENMAAALKAMAGRRVAESGAWQADGARSPAHHLARASGTSLARAREALETAGQLGRLPELDAALRRGELSAAQAAPIADAAAVDPGAAPGLVDQARRGCLGELLAACGRTKAAAEPDPEARRRAIHARRSLRRRTCADGAGELTYRTTVEEVGRVLAVLRGYADREFRAAHRAGRRESAEAYLADGLLAAVCEPAGLPGPAGWGAPAAGTTGAGAAEVTPDGGGDDQPAAAEVPLDGGAGSEPAAAAEATPLNGGGAPAADGPPAPDRARREAVAAWRAEMARRGVVARGHPPAGAPGAPAGRRPAPVKLLVRIDWAAWARGWPVAGEVCEVAGVGPVPASLVRAMAASGDAFLAAVVTKGTDVVAVAHAGRRPTAAQQSALDWMGSECMVEGCAATVGLETDHREDWAATHITALGALDRPCGHHHRLKTYHGWAFVDGVGKRPMVPPDDPRHPRHQAGARARAREQIG